MILELLATAVAAPPDTQISSAAVISIISAISALVIGVIAKLQVDKVKNESREVTLKKPVPTVVTREEPQWATKPDLDDHIERMDRQISDIWMAIQGERSVARESLSKIHQRLDTQSNATATLQGTVNEVKESVRALLDIALHRKPPSTRG